MSTHIASLYHRADPRLRAFMKANWATIDDLLNQAEERARHQKRVQAEMLEPLTTTFVIKRESLPQAEALAQKLGIRIEVGEIDTDRTWAQIAEVALTNKQRETEAKRHEVSLSFDERHRISRTVKHYAEIYCQITAIAPPATDRVVAIAEEEAGGTHLYNLPYEAPFWNDSTASLANFRRCDACHKDRPRKKLFVVENVKTGTFRVIGGECAKNLNLGEKLSSLLGAFKSFARGVEDFGDEGEYQKAKRESFDPRYILVAAWQIIRAHGYLSSAGASKQSLIESIPSTGRRVREFLSQLGKDSRLPPHVQTAFYQQLREEGDQFLKRATEFSKELSEKAKRDVRIFGLANEVKIGLETGAYKSVGALAWVVSELPKWEAQRGRAAQQGPASWIPAMAVKDASIVFMGPEYETDYSRDDRIGVAVKLRPEFVSFGHGVIESANSNVQIESKYPLVSVNLGRVYERLYAPEGKRISIGVTVNSEGLVTILKSAKPQDALYHVETAVKRALYKLADEMEYEPNIETLRAYERQEPGFAARMDSEMSKGGKPSNQFRKALQTGALTKGAAKKLMREVPGRWKCLSVRALPQTQFGTPQMYAFARVSDGALLNVKSGKGMLYLDASEEIRESCKYETHLAYIEPGDQVYLSGGFSWPIPWKEGEDPIGSITRTTWEFSDGVFPDRLRSTPEEEALCLERKAERRRSEERWMRQSQE